MHERNGYPGTGSERSGAADRDAGLATVVSATISLVLLSALWLGMQLAAVVITRHRAEGAADLAALAVAAHAPRGTGDACGQAERVVHRMQAGLVSCRLHRWEARVRVRAAPPPLPFLAVHARARAGPVDT